MKEGRGLLSRAQGHRSAADGPVVLRLPRGDGSVLLLGDGQPTGVMGVINLTPDSFSDGGQLDTPQAALAHAEALVRQGADLLDLGAESTRPGATPVTPAEEWRRLSAVLPALARAGLPVALSVDTRHPEVARAAADHGVALLNLPFPGEWLDLPAAPRRDLFARFPAVALMHARGTPATMNGRCTYGDLLDDVVGELLDVATGLDLADAPGLLFDPGLGFAKTAEGSLHLLGQVGALRARLGRPVLVGASRKSFLGKASGLPVGERLVPSLAAAVLAAAQGAAVVRVHDVAETRAALSVVRAVHAAGGSRAQ